MAEKKQVNVRVDESRKREWDQYVKKSAKVTSLSHLVRLAVEREVADEQCQSSAPPLDVDDIELDGLTERLEEIDSTVSELAAEMRELEGTQIVDEEAVSEAADRLYDIIPRDTVGDTSTPAMTAQNYVEDALYWMEHHEDGTMDALAEAEPEMEYGVVEAYRRMLALTDVEMERAIERLMDYSSRVHHVETGEFDILFEEE